MQRAHACERLARGEHVWVRAGLCYIAARAKRARLVTIVAVFSFDIV